MSEHAPSSPSVPEPNSQASESSSSAHGDGAVSVRNRRYVVQDDTETGHSTGTSRNTYNETPQHRNLKATVTVENEKVEVLEEQKKQQSMEELGVQGDEQPESSASSSSRAPSGSTSEGQRTTTANRRTTGEDRNGEYDCNICFEMASDPVLTLCGHLYCWPCLHQWIERNRTNPLCPVCKAGTGQDKVIPIYGRGKDVKDPRLKHQNVPNRPAGQRPEPNVVPDQSDDGTGRFFTPPMGSYFVNGQGRAYVNRFAGRFVFSPWPNYEMEFGVAGVPIEQNAQTAQQLFLARFFLMLGVLILLGIFLY